MKEATTTVYRPDAQDHVRSIVLDLILTILTFGLFNLWVQYRQIKTINAVLREDKYSFLWWLLFTIVTFGFYHIYHEYRKTLDMTKVIPGMQEYEPVLSVVLTAFGMHIVADAIQQYHFNRYFGSEDL